MADVGSITVESSDVESRLGRIADFLGVDMMGEFLGVNLTQYVQGRAEARFSTEGDDVTGPWLPLNPATVEIREGLGYPGDHPINNRTGDLENYITKSQSQMSATGGSVIMTYPGAAPSGELLDKVQTAQSGKGDPNTPPRPVLGFNEADLIYVLSEIALGLTETELIGFA